MVIAIMGKTFEDVTENLEKSALITRTEMYADFQILLTFDKFDEPYLYVITPTANDSESEIECLFENSEKNHSHRVAKLTESF